MPYTFNPFTGNFDQTIAPGSIPDPLTLNNLTVNNLLTANHIHGGIAGSLYIHVKNTSGVALAKGAPVYAVGAVGDTTTLEIAGADAANADKIPAIGLLGEALDNNASGHAVMFGEITGFNTGSYQINDELYLASGGGLTATKPVNGYTQSLAVVGRVHASTGTVLVWTASGLITPATSGAIGSSGLTMSTARILARSSAGTGAIEEHTLPTGFDLSGGALRAPAEIGIACSDETSNLTTGTAKVTFKMPYAMTLTAVRASVNTAPTGSTLVVDINEEGVSVLSTKLSIDASEKSSTTAATAAVISDAALADDAEITIDIDQIGSTIAGKGLKVWLIGRRA